MKIIFLKTNNLPWPRTGSVVRALLALSSFCMGSCYISSIARLSEFSAAKSLHELPGELTVVEEVVGVGGYEEGWG